MTQGQQSFSFLSDDKIFMKFTIPSPTYVRRYGTSLQVKYNQIVIKFIVLLTNQMLVRHFYSIAILSQMQSSRDM